MLDELENTFIETNLIHHLNELARKFSLYVLLWNTKIKSLSVVEWDLQVWKLIFFTIFVRKAVYCCQFCLKEIKKLEKNCLILQSLKKTFTGVTKCSSCDIQQSVYSSFDSKALLRTGNKRNPCMQNIFVDLFTNSEKKYMKSNFSRELLQKLLNSRSVQG